MNKLIEERLKQHKDNLALWENGVLNPTEPDEEERELVKERLKACIYELEYLQNRMTPSIS